MRAPVVIRIDIVEQAMLTAGIPTARQVVRVIQRSPKIPKTTTQQRTPAALPQTPTSRGA